MDRLILSARKLEQFSLPNQAFSVKRGQREAAMFAHAYNVSHVKDEESDEGKVYRVNVAQIFGIAKQAGYRGYFSMEFQGRGDPCQGTKRLLFRAAPAAI